MVFLFLVKVIIFLKNNRLNNVNNKSIGILKFQIYDMLPSISINIDIGRRNKKEILGKIVQKSPYPQWAIW